MTLFLRLQKAKIKRIVRKKPKLIKAVEVVANDEISCPYVLVIDENGNNLGTLHRNSALDLARSKELDLIQVSPNREGTCTAILGDISKYKYDKLKKEKKNKLNQTSGQKEWWFKVNIQIRDVKIKLENVKKYLEKGGVAKLTVKYEKKASKEDMDNTFNIIQEEFSSFAKPISEKSFDGKNISIIVKLKK